MARHQGALVTVGARTVRGRSGETFPLDRLELTDGGLYYGRFFEGHPSVRYHERWLLPAQGWVVNRFAMRPDAPPFWCDWYIDLDGVEIDGDTWRVDDRFLDVGVIEGCRYEVLDADELADGVEQGAITLAESLAALRDLNDLCRVLPDLGFSGDALLARYAPGLPR